MKKDVFVSHATADAPVAQEVCGFLEAKGIRCWIAPRDVVPGAAFEEQILAAIAHSHAMVLILSGSSNESPFVKNEVNRAFVQRKPIFTLRAEDVSPAGSLELYLASHHWIDGFPPPLGERLPRFADAILALIGRSPVPSPSVGARGRQEPTESAPFGEVGMVRPERGTVTPDQATPERRSEDRSGAALGGVSRAGPADAPARPSKLALIGTSARLSAPTAPEGVSWVRNLAVTTRFAYVVAPREGVRIHDVAVPETPRLVSVIPYPADPMWFEPVGHLGILRARSAGVRIVDLSDPVEPRSIPFDNFHNVRFNNCGLAILSAGTVVIDLCHNGAAGVRVFDFADPAAVRDIGTIHFDAGTATIHGSYLMLGSHREPMVKAVELTERGLRELPALPLDSDQGSVTPRAMSAVGTRLYVVGETARRTVLLTYGLERFPGELRPVSEQPAEKVKGLFGVQMTQDGHWLCLADGGRVSLFSLEDPDSPALAATLEGPWQAATVRRDLLYASDARNIFIYRIAGTS